MKMRELFESPKPKKVFIDVFKDWKSEAFKLADKQQRDYYRFHDQDNEWSIENAANKTVAAWDPKKKSGWILE